VRTETAEGRASPEIPVSLEKKELRTADLLRFRPPCDCAYCVHKRIQMADIEGPDLGYRITKSLRGT
jgi:hypothetical protein